MRVLDKKIKISRRGLLESAGVSLVALSVLPSGMIVGADNSWAASATNLKSETFATLVQMSRDVYPHDRIGDKHYAKAVMAFDGAAGKSADDKKVFEDGVAGLDKAAKAAHGVPYAKVGWEIYRVALLKAIETSAFFQKVRGSLVVGIYNNPDVWAILGYEGESASKGGYIDRGFDDIDWLDKA